MITLLQAFLIGLIYYSSNTSFLAGLGYFSTWRPLVNGLLVGVVLGDPLRGLLVGGMINVLYLGYMSVGGTLGIGDAALAGILGATVGIIAPLPDVQQSVGIGVIAGVLLGNLGFALLSLRMTLDNRIVARMDHAAERGAAQRIVWLNIVPAQALLFALTVPSAAVLALLTSLLSPAMFGLAPARLLHGLGIAGTGVAGALGIALAMRANTQGWGMVAFVAGFLMMLITGISPAPLMAIAITVCGLGYLLKKALRTRPTLTPAALRTFWLWQFFSHSSYSFDRLQGSGFACALAPAVQRSYPADLRASALKRNLTFFNVEPNWGSLVIGVALNQEEECARGAISEEVIITTRQSLMGSISGFGDRTSQADILPLFLSIGLAISLDGTGFISPLAGVLIYLALICPLMLAISYYSFRAGYLQGRDAIISILGNPTLKLWIRVAQLLGALMLGVLAAMPTVTGVMTGMANHWLAAAISLVLILVLYVAVHGLNIKPTWVLLVMAIVSAILAARTIL